MIQAISIDPTSVEALLLNGLTLLEVKKSQVAITHYQAAVRLAPQRFEAYKGKYTSAMQVRFSLASLAKISISETIIKIVPAVVIINGLIVTFRVAVVSG